MGETDGERVGSPGVTAFSEGAGDGEVGGDRTTVGEAGGGVEGAGMAS